MEQRVQPAAPTTARNLNSPDSAENAATGTAMDMLDQTSRPTAPEKLGTQTTGRIRSKIIIPNRSTDRG